MSRSRVFALLLAVALAAGGAVAQDAVPLANWTAPPYWTPPAAGQADRAPGEMQASAEGMNASSQALPSSPLPFTAITPCRLADTRGNGFTGQYGPPSIPNSTRDFTITGQCGIPAGAVAASLNFTILDMTTGGDIRAYPAGGAIPLVSTQNWIGTTGVVANAAIVAIGTGGAITIKVDGLGVIDLIIDVNGYYGPQSVVTSLNTLIGRLTLAQGTNVTITPSGNTLTIDAPLTAGPTGPTGATGANGTNGTNGRDGCNRSDRG